MSRLIDADALWMDVIRSVDYCDDILEFIERQPTVEPEIIRCKDCVHYSSHKDDYMCGINVLAYVHENDYCSRAERRTQ